VHDPGAADRGGELHLPVRELPAPVLIRDIAAGPDVHLGEQRGQVAQPQAAGERGQQLLITRVPVLLRELVGPQADHPPHRLRHRPRGQCRQDPRVRRHPPRPRGMPDGGTPRDPGPVDQPGHRAVVPVPGRPGPGGERGQQERPRRGRDRVGLLEFAQGLGLDRGGQPGGVRSSQVAQPGADHVQRLADTAKGRGRAHLGHLPAGTGRCWRRFSSLAGRFLGSEFDSTPRLRHFPGYPRHPAKSVRMSEMWSVLRHGREPGRGQRHRPFGT
jgi:hypothetical protein